MPKGRSVFIVYAGQASHLKASKRGRTVQTLDSASSGLLDTGENRDMTRVLISGASGLIGSALVATFEQKGAEVVRLTRKTSGKATEIEWDPRQALDPRFVSGFDVVIHLAGESIMGRWTETKKNAIRESRVKGTANLADALVRAEIKPGAFVCASATGFYGDRGDDVLTEQSTRGNGFLAEVARDWENATRVAADSGVRTVNLRTGLVLSAHGGALAKMLPAFKLGLGGRLGSGQQWWSWIHVDDVVGAIHHITSAPIISGPVNLVAPNPVRNVEFTQQLASELHRPAFFPVPAFALELAFGRTPAHELFLSSARARPEKLLSSGYDFRFPDLTGALKNLI